MLPSPLPLSFPSNIYFSCVHVFKLIKAGGEEEGSSSGAKLRADQTSREGERGRTAIATAWAPAAPLPPCPRVLLLGTWMLCCKRCFPSPGLRHSGPSRLDGAPRVKWLVWAAVAVGTGLHPPPPSPPAGAGSWRCPPWGAGRAEALVMSLCVQTGMGTGRRERAEGTLWGRCCPWPCGLHSRDTQGCGSCGGMLMRHLGGC